MTAACSRSRQPRSRSPRRPTASSRVSARAAALAEGVLRVNEEVSASTEQTSASTQQVAASAADMASSADALRGLVAQFSSISTSGSYLRRVCARVSHSSARASSDRVQPAGRR